VTSVDITVVADAEEAVWLVGERLAEQARTGGHVVLTGGSTPRSAYELAAKLEPDWSRVDVWFTDERCVPPDDERSNYRLVEETLLDRLERLPAAVHRMESPEQYERELDGVGTFDLVLLGLGPDGHVASLFPNFPTLDIDDRDVVGSEAGLEPFVDRITLTLPRLCNTREMQFLVTGEDKADAVARAFRCAPTPATPGSLARAAEGTTGVVLDRAATSKL
jgi:6-phosphogluconolactonase